MNRLNLLDILKRSPYKWALPVFLLLAIIGLALDTEDGGTWLVVVALALTAFTLYKAWQATDGKAR